VSSLLSFGYMAELDWTTLDVTRDHLQNLMSQGYMTAVELATCRVSEDPVSPAPMRGGGYVTTCTEFYERRFGAPSHQFLCSLLQFYGLELYHLTPSWILHMAAFVTLCEAYMGIESHRAWTRKWRCWAVWTSFSYLGLELIPTSTFQCPTLRSVGGKYSSF
jgi:hypothetical protein